MATERSASAPVPFGQAPRREVLAAVADLRPLADGLLGELPAQDRFAVVADSCHGQQGGA